MQIPSFHDQRFKSIAPATHKLERSYDCMFSAIRLSFDRANRSLIVLCILKLTIFHWWRRLLKYLLKYLLCLSLISCSSLFVKPLEGPFDVTVDKKKRLSSSCCHDIFLLFSFWQPRSTPMILWIELAAGTVLIVVAFFSPHIITFSWVVNFLICLFLRSSPCGGI